MTEEQAEKLGPGDEIMITTSDGCAEWEWGTILKVEAVSDRGIHVGNIIITDPRRVDLYRRVHKAKADLPPRP